ncbi:MAG TPA: MmcQ/YjbR family DNA-binding protein [Micromonosporaceae bacterium]|nr:MmcQ/YjbR family DNA-binding protein [Micromonosporaceae bacterium]
MTASDDVRRIALALPDTTEGTHFGQPTIRVAGKNVIGFDGDAHATLALPSSTAASVAANHPESVELIHRNTKPIGIRVDLTRIGPGDLEALIHLCWRTATGAEQPGTPGNGSGRRG